uniref:Uncharacterized protein n=1 Tax=Odontella aurita TaxID=265563 RepID=A0A7S4MNE0_9STRA|mmetsp:Transcript_26944/g.79608  ORF Transcript_26944/g.79608 Transcript_26944/m.79608 type:complete len:202 (+) Transcript_26944:177-782(+)
MPSSSVLITKKDDVDPVFLAKGKVLYDNNIRLITQTMSKKGLYLVQMGNMGEITDIRRNMGTSNAGRAGTFRLICRGNGTVPTFGNTDALSDTQRNVVQIMQKDFERICNVVERDSQHGLGGGKRSESLRNRFGGLPVTEGELRETGEKDVSAVAKRKSKGKQKSKRGKTKKEEEETALSFDEMLNALKKGVVPDKVDFEE